MYIKKTVGVPLSLAAAFIFSAIAMAEDKPNQGRAEVVGGFVGSVGGAAAAGAAATATGLGGAGAGAAGVVGERAGNAAGSAVGAYLDGRAADNAQTGRGGPSDPRYNPGTLLGQ